MNPFQIISGLLACGVVFCAFGALLVWLGIALPLVILGVYLGAVWFMTGLQRRAIESSAERQRSYSRAIHDNHYIQQQKFMNYNRQSSGPEAANSTLSA